MRPAGTSTFCVAQRVLDVLRRDVVGGEPRRIEPDAHGVAALAEDPRLGDAGDRLQPVLYEAIGEVGDLQRRMPVRRERQIHDRLRVGLDLGDDRLVDLVGQAAAHPADAVADVVGHGIGVARQLEAHDDQAALLTRDRAHEVDAFDAGDRLLEHARDLALQHLRAGAAVDRFDQDDRRIDVRVFAHRQAAERHQADQHDDEAQHRREDRPADADFGKRHRQDAFGATMRTAAPSRSFTAPSVTITASRARPSTISTWPWRRCPIFTLVSRPCRRRRERRTDPARPGPAPSRARRSLRMRSSISSVTRANMPERSTPSRFGRRARRMMARPLGSKADRSRRPCPHRSLLAIASRLIRRPGRRSTASHGSRARGNRPSATRCSRGSRDPGRD